MTKLIWISAIFWAMTLASSSNASPQTLYLLTEQFPPYNMSSDGKHFAHKATQIDGLCTEIIKNMMALTSIKYRIKLRNWSFGIDRVKRNKNHGLYCTVKNDERSDIFEWVGPLTSIRWTLFAHPESSITLKTVAQAKSKNYVIGGYKGDVMTNYLIKQGYNVSVINNDQTNPRRLELGQIDLWVTDELAGPYKAADTTEMTDMKKVISFKTTPMYLALNKETDPEITAELQRVIGVMRQSGDIDRIENGYGL